MSLSLEERRQKLKEAQAAYDEEVQMRAELEARVQNVAEARATVLRELREMEAAPEPGKPQQERDGTLPLPSSNYAGSFAFKVGFAAVDPVADPLPMLPENDEPTKAAADASSRTKYEGPTEPLTDEGDGDLLPLLLCVLD